MTLDFPPHIEEIINRLDRLKRREDFYSIYPHNSLGYGEMNDLRQLATWLLAELEKDPSWNVRTI